MSKLAKKLETSIGKAAAEDLARQTKFVQRSSELGGFDFALLNMKSIDSDGFSSLTEQCVQLKKDYKVIISKQGLDARYNEKSTLFIQSIFLQVLKIQMNKTINLSAFNCFSGVYLRDATSSQLPSFFKELFKGSGGSASTAGLKVDLTYDVKGDEIEMEFRNAASSDSTCEDIPIKEGGLYLQDLGYFKLVRFKHIAKQGGFFISRYKYPTNIYLSEKEKVQVEIKDLTKGMKPNQVISKTVYLGQKERLKVKMIVQKVPQKVADRRRRKLKEHARRKGQTLTKERLAACDFTILITNIHDIELLSDEQVLKVYRIRWQSR